MTSPSKKIDWGLWQQLVELFPEKETLKCDPPAEVTPTATISEKKNPVKRSKFRRKRAVSVDSSPKELASITEAASTSAVRSSPYIFHDPFSVFHDAIQVALFPLKAKGIVNEVLEVPDSSALNSQKSVTSDSVAKTTSQIPVGVPSRNAQREARIWSLQAYLKGIIDDPIHTLPNRSLERNLESMETLFPKHYRSIGTLKKEVNPGQLFMKEAAHSTCSQCSQLEPLDVHVFIDHSNVLVGARECLGIRGPAGLNYAALVDLIQLITTDVAQQGSTLCADSCTRDFQIKKQILVASHPLTELDARGIHAIQKVGFETHVLARVPVLVSSTPQGDATKEVKSAGNRTRKQSSRSKKVSPPQNACVALNCDGKSSEEKCSPILPSEKFVEDPTSGAVTAAGLVINDVAAFPAVTQKPYRNPFLPLEQFLSELDRSGVVESTKRSPSTSTNAATSFPMPVKGPTFKGNSSPIKKVTPSKQTTSGSSIPQFRIVPFTSREQFVDELLLCKMSESLLDQFGSNAIMVLFSGDGASTEYLQGGFVAHVVRALRRGWIVAVVSFSKTFSTTYFHLREILVKELNSNKLVLYGLDSEVGQLIQLDGKDK
jgi:hypothetical protein